MFTKDRVGARFNLKIPLRFRPILNPQPPVQRAESVNLSQHGVYFATDFPLNVGTPLELFLAMPRELTGREETEVHCIARVVHIQRNAFLGSRSGVGVHIERYESVSTPEGRVS